MPEPVSNYPVPHDRPLEYPGKRPPVSFVVKGKTVFRLQFLKSHKVSHASVVLGPGGGTLELDEFLKQAGVAPIEERFAVMGYGSNAVPGQLLSKFGVDSTVPVVFGRLGDSNLVYNLISNWGYAFAELALGQTGSRASVAVTFLDKAQLELMISSEQNYHLAVCPSNLHLQGGRALGGSSGAALYLFAGFRRLWIPSNHICPVPIAALPSQGRQAVGLTQQEVLQLVIEDFDLYSVGIDRPLQLVNRLREEAEWPEQSPKLKYTLQELVDKDPRSLPSLASQLELVSPESQVPVGTALEAS